MEALLQSLATKYGFEYAAKLLGLDQQTQNPKYAISMGDTTLDVGNMAKRGLLNRSINAITSGSSGILSTVGPLALGAGAIYFLNKNREKLTGYKTQQAYEDARDQRIANNRLDYITDRMISGKKTANYEEALLDSGAGAVKIDDVIYSGPEYGFQNDNGNDGASTTGSKGKGTSETAKGGMGTASFGQSFHARRGGIASL